MITSNLRFFSPRQLWLLVLPLAVLASVTPARAFIDLAPTIGKVIGDSQRIAVVEIVQFDESGQTLKLKEIRSLKGELSTPAILHHVASADGVIPRGIVSWAEPGARGVLFASRTTTLVCFGEGWYQVKSSGGDWKLGIDRTDLSLAYYGTVSRLADGIAAVLAGGDAILTMVQHGIEDAASFDLALNRTHLPAIIRVQRFRANLRMPGMVMAMSGNPAYIIGQGWVGEEELPALIPQLASPDATARAEATVDLQRLGYKARSAEPALTKLLSDSNARVRISAASALLRIAGKNDQAIQILQESLTNTDPNVRRAAAVAVGRAGSAASPLVNDLAVILKDRNFSAQSAAVQAVATLGPIAAAAKPALVPLLNDRKQQIEAADALGRIGLAAQPVPAPLLDMLAESQPMAVRWAAVRAMAQIGGPEARPAVDFIIKTMPEAAEIESYNMQIYLSLLGPVATNAIEASQNSKLMNPVLPGATLWAIKADSLPWQSAGGRGPGGRRGFGPPGGFPGGFPGGPGVGFPGGMGGDLNSLMYVAYFRELGERLRPVALLMLQKMRDGTAGNIPTWGYKLLNCAPQEALGQLSDSLVSDDLATREKATVALGYMGTGAFPAQDKLRVALAKAGVTREGRLLEWALRETALE